MENNILDDIVNLNSLENNKQNKIRNSLRNKLSELSTEEISYLLFNKDIEFCYLFGLLSGRLEG